MLALMTEKFRMYGRFKKHRISPKNSSERIAKAKRPKQPLPVRQSFPKWKTREETKGWVRGGVDLDLGRVWGEKWHEHDQDTLYDIL